MFILEPFLQQMLEEEQIQERITVGILVRVLAGSCSRTATMICGCGGGGLVYKDVTLVSLTWPLRSCSKGSVAPSIVTNTLPHLLGARRDLVGAATLVFTGLLWWAPRFFPVGPREHCCGLQWTYLYLGLSCRIRVVWVGDEAGRLLWEGVF